MKRGEKKIEKQNKPRQFVCLRHRINCVVCKQDAEQANDLDQSVSLTNFINKKLVRKSIHRVA